MSSTKNKKLTENIKRLNTPQRILKVFCYTPIAKPLNGSLPRSSNSYLLKLSPITYTYGKGKEKKEETSEVYFIKGLRGALRHASMQVCFESGLEVCHSTDKQFDKEGNSLLPSGFHLLGSCQHNGQCIMHEVYGSKGNKSIIAVYAYPITSINHKTAELEHTIQNVHLAMENRVCMTFDGKTVQDYGEKYFSGHFTFEIDVSQCSRKQLGLLIRSILALEKLGRGFNAGYGHVEVKKFQLLKRIKKKIPIFDGESFVIKTEISEESLDKEVIEALEEWDKYVSNA
ncbi:MAG: hypothetical protein ACFFCI_00645 [Promethearchaeota archaeon]